LAGLFWALYQMLAWFDGRWREMGELELRKRLWKAALGCAIAVAANLTFLIPVFLLAAAFCILILQAGAKPSPGSKPVPPAPSKGRKKGRTLRHEALPTPTRSYAPLMNFVLPVVASAIVFLLAAPLDLARSQDFTSGTSSAIKRLRSLVDCAFAYGGSSGALHKIERISSGAALIVLPGLALAALIAVCTTRRPWRSMTELATWLASLAVVGSAILLLAAHLVFGMPYPEDRTGVYFVPLAILSALGLARMPTDRPRLPRWIGLAVVIVLVSFAAEFAAQWNVKSFLVWRFDADTKRIFEAMEAAPKPVVPVRMGVSWVLEPALNYYRDVRKATWMVPVERDGVGGSRQFYAAAPWDQDMPLWRNVTLIYKGPVSGSALAVPQAHQ
jgi:hypothetical protein